MAGLNRSPVYSKQHSASPRLPLSTRTNPFDSDDEVDNSNKTIKTSGRTSSEPSLHMSTNPFDESPVKGSYSAQSYLSSADNSRYKNDFRDFGGIENQTVQELENYSMYKAQETTKTVKNCLKLAEDIREDATKTLVTLHQQGEQITRTHKAAADIEHDLSRGEKLLGSLGGLFSKTWKPKMSRPITGPIITKDDPVQRKVNHLEQRERLGLTSASKGQSRAHTLPPEPTNALQKVEVEKAKQDDALSDLSNLLLDLKDMAMDMGSEIDRQNKALSHVEDDVDELNFRVKGANQRTRRLLGK
ncbi:SNAP25 homologous protein SNAP33 [Striga hermonthica]|uniref:SNAP25 homologous protein SNAP33 n=1 Tax=Striga hermonthica TaxID=68872 RepID=A0A9N7R906_STRHE|nr:SNAP25 homologous protein SNAP33 [Striga hermonthica]